MPCYCVTIEGSGFPGHLFDEPDRQFGFFTTAYVKAANAEAAEIAAVEAVRDEFREKLPSPSPGDPVPSLHLTDIDEVPALPESEAVSGATWFPMESS